MISFWNSDFSMHLIMFLNAFTLWKKDYILEGIIIFHSFVPSFSTIFFDFGLLGLSSLHFITFIFQTSSRNEASKMEIKYYGENIIHFCLLRMQCYDKGQCLQVYVMILIFYFIGTVAIAHDAAEEVSLDVAKDILASQ